MGDRVRIIREYPPGAANMPHLGVDGKTGRLYGEPDGLGVSQFPYWVVVDDGDENPVWCHEVVALIDFEEAPLLDAWRTPPEHYQVSSGMQPWDVVDAFGLNFYEGSVLKYLLRWRRKGGRDDLLKARNYLDKLIAHGEIRND